MIHNLKLCRTMSVGICKITCKHHPQHVLLLPVLARRRRQAHSPGWYPFWSGTARLEPPWPSTISSPKACTSRRPLALATHHDVIQFLDSIELVQSGTCNPVLLGPQQDGSQWHKGLQCQVCAGPQTPGPPHHYRAPGRESNEELRNFQTSRLCISNWLLLQTLTSILQESQRPALLRDHCKSLSHGGRHGDRGP
jgi:hypothetical protein